jgi:glycosyltransferase involved in cell wall biosynthesis
MPTDQPLISVIIPCYNYGAYIRDAIDSVRAQTYQNWEMLLVDDGSKDNTAAIAQEYVAQDARISYHFQANQGLSAARNTGLGLAKGEYVQLLDAGPAAGRAGFWRYVQFSALRSSGRA